MFLKPNGVVFNQYHSFFVSRNEPFIATRWHCQLRWGHGNWHWRSINSRFGSITAQQQRRRRRRHVPATVRRPSSSKFDWRHQRFNRKNVCRHEQIKHQRWKIGSKASTTTHCLHPCTVGIFRAKISMSKIFVRGRSKRCGRHTEFVRDSGENLVSE